MSEIKSFIIHLDRAQAREAQVARLRADLPIASEIVAAIDAQSLNADKVAHIYHRTIHQPAYPFALSRNEIACFLSHRQVWAMIVEQNCAAGLILEDDAHLDADFANAFALACDFMTEQHFIRFPHKLREKGEVLAERHGVRLIMPSVVGLGQVAYLVSRKAAEQLLASTMVFDRPVDVLLQMFWLTKVRPLSILPSGIREISAQIGGSSLHGKRTMREKWRREILRPLYRWRLARLSKKYTNVIAS